MDVAFLGLGALGRPMAANLAAAFPTQVWNRTSAVAYDHAADTGTTVLGRLEDLPQVAVVCSCLPTDREVAEVVERAAPALRPGMIWLDHTSGAPDGAREVAARLGELGVRYLDAPVSGGIAGAVAGTLTVMVGGDAAALEEVRPVLDAVAARVVHVGGVGAGMAVKAVNNALLATSLWAAGEGLLALAAIGVDPRRAVEVIATSTGRSFSTEELIPTRALDRSFPHTFALDLLAKDVRLAADVLAGSGVDGEVLALVERLTSAAAEALPGADHVELLRVLERASGIELSSVE
ncbi:MAG: NAD(P)-dependent oxidoreductase [Nitriliruptoraceae bacterium]